MLRQNKYSQANLPSTSTGWSKMKREKTTCCCYWRKRLEWIYWFFTYGMSYQTSGTLHSFMLVKTRATSLIHDPCCIHSHYSLWFTETEDLLNCQHLHSHVTPCAVMCVNGRNEVCAGVLMCAHLRVVSPGTCCAGLLMQTVLVSGGLLGGVDSIPTACSAPPTGQWGTTMQMHFWN